MKNLFLHKTIQLCLLLSLLVLGCYGGCGLSASGEGSNYEFKAEIHSNQTNKVTVNAQSPIQGTEVQVEKNSIKENQTISIDKTDKPKSLPSGYQTAGECISLNTNGSSQFAKPVQVKLPYSDSNQDTFIDGTNIPEKDVRVLYWNEGLEEWKSKKVLDIEANNNLAKFETTHFSVYLTAVEEQDRGTIDNSEVEIQPGESFVGEPAFINTYNSETGEIEREMIDPGKSHYLTVRRDERLLLAVVGPFVTLASSHNATIQRPDFTYATFNATKYYPKVAKSESAANWNWTCDFVTEHTNLKNYKAIDENIREPGGEAIFCEAEVVNPDLVRLIWSIDASQEITQGHMLAIEFMGTYAE